MLSERVWEILAENDIVPEPKLPQISRIVNKARDKRCSVQLNYPSDPDAAVLAIVTRVGQRFTSEMLKDVEALATALADCLQGTEPVQVDMFDKEKSTPTPARGLFDEVSDHLSSVAEDDEGKPDESDDEGESDDDSDDESEDEEDD